MGSIEDRTVDSVNRVTHAECFEGVLDCLRCGLRCRAVFLLVDGFEGAADSFEVVEFLGAVCIILVFAISIKDRI